MRKKLLCGIVFSMVTMMAVCGFAQEFNLSDLAGTWYAYTSKTNSTVGSYWLYGSFTVDGSGNVTAGTYVSPDSTTVALTGGQVFLDANGIMKGTLTAEGGLSETFPNGKMDPNKTIISFVGLDNTGSLDIGIAVKGGGTFSTSDLAGTWHAYISEANPTLGKYWAYGSFTIDSSGNFSGGTYILPNGASVAIMGGQLLMDANGLISGTLTAEGGSTITVPSGKMNSNKTMISFVGADGTSGALDVGTAIRGGGTFLTSDLAGIWYAQVSETNSVLGTYWIYGPLPIDSSGKVGAGTYILPDGTNVTITGGQLFMDMNGIISGTLTAEGGSTIAVASGKMDTTKTIINFVGAETTAGALDIGIAIKGGLWSGAVDLGGGWRWLDWFGYFNVNASPWIYHQEHQWLYPFGESTSSVTFWDAHASAFWWTSDTLYPYLYRFADSCWLFYEKGSASPRWFYNLYTSNWESD